MATRNPSARRRRFTPGAEGLETRQVLSSLSTIPSAQVSGTDADGDRWTLTLYGPGTMNVVDINGNTFTKSMANTPDLINTITIGGSISSQTRLVGKVTPAAGGDGKVFFQNLHVTSSGQLPKLDANDTSNNKQVQNGISAVDMPQFYLGHTDLTKPTDNTSAAHSGYYNAGEITIPGGVNTLRFGGVDTTYTPPGGTPLNTDGQNDEFTVDLGIPVAYGTSIIVNRVVSDAQAATSTSTSPTQKTVTFAVTGRINLFQANEIDGNTSSSSLIPSQFQTSTATGAAGGTYLVSRGAAVTGAIGYVRVGGNATNFTTFAISDDLAAAAADTITDPKISNFYVGQETNNVILVAPGGSRDVYFGRGMDNVQINTLLISHLFANRGANNSNVVSSRSIYNAAFGGDVTGTNLSAGYAQSLASQANIPAAGFSAGAGVFNGVKLPTIADRVSDSSGTLVPLAQNGGTINLRVAGNFTNSIASASVDPDPSGLLEPGVFSNVTTKRFPFGAPDNLVLPKGFITAKVEGTVNNADNTLVSPDTPNKAFFARNVSYSHGPVTPPNVVEPPLGPTQYHKGQRFLFGVMNKDHVPRKK